MPASLAELFGVNLPGPRGSQAVELLFVEDEQQPRAPEVAHTLYEQLRTT